MDVEHGRRTEQNVVAIIPVGTLDGAKSRLGAVLDAEERHELVVRMTERTVRATVGNPGIVETIVVTPDDAVRAIALDLGARPLRQRTSGLNDGIREARAEAIAAGADAIVILPIDLPAIASAAIGDVLAILGDRDPPLVGVVPDRHGRGTNVLLLAPPDAIDVRFGGDSRSAHSAAAAAAGATYVELSGPLTLDLDTPDDLLLAEAAAVVPIDG